MKSYSIARIPGDGIGTDVLDAAWDVLQCAANSCGFSLNDTVFDWSCETWLATGSMMPDDGLDRLRGFDAIFLGAVGWPQKVPDAVSLHGLLLPIRKAFDQFANVRPHRLLRGVRGPLRNEAFDILCIRENTEGEYSGAGGRVHQGTPHEIAVETSVFTRRGVERVVRFAFEKARERRGRLASVSKSNAQKHSMVFWDDVTREVARDYPDVEVTTFHVDAMAARFILAPETLDVVVSSNLFGDILTDIGAAIQGGLGFAASANINPSRELPSMFEPVHGSAPDIAHLGIANPMAAIWSGAMMLEHLGEDGAARLIMQALEATTAAGFGVNGDQRPTREVAGHVIEAMAKPAG